MKIFVIILAVIGCSVVGYFVICWLQWLLTMLNLRRRFERLKRKAENAKCEFEAMEKKLNQIKTDIAKLKETPVSCIFIEEDNED